MIRTALLTLAITAHLRHWWRLLTCSGGIGHLAADSSAACYLAAARGVDVSALEISELIYFHCVKGHDHCAACPRFQACRQSLTLGEHRHWDLHVGGSIISVKAEVCDRHREGAQVDYRQHDAGRATSSKAITSCEPDSHAVIIDSPPCVDDAQHRTHQGNGERHGLKHCGIHAPIVQHGHALPTVTYWLAGITIALLIGCAHYLDPIDDHSAEADQAVDLQAAIVASIAQEKFDKAAQAVCGPQSPWVQLNDGSVQCSTKYGKPTITVRVSP